MDYTLIIYRVNGSHDSFSCATITDVCNIIASCTQSQFKPYIAAPSVMFQILDNAKDPD